MLRRSCFYPGIDHIKISLKALDFLCEISGQIRLVGVRVRVRSKNRRWGRRRDRVRDKGTGRNKGICRGRGMNRDRDRDRDRDRVCYVVDVKSLADVVPPISIDKKIESSSSETQAF